MVGIAWLMELSAAIAVVPSSQAICDVVRATIEAAEESARQLRSKPRGALATQTVRRRAEVVRAAIAQTTRELTALNVDILGSASIDLFRERVSCVLAAGRQFASALEVREVHFAHFVIFEA